MAKAYAFMANGTEESELLITVDILRRAGVDTALVSVDGGEITSSHGVRIGADVTIERADLSDADLLFVPGGMPGSKRLGACEPLISAIRGAIAGGRRVAAVCAAPSVVLGAHGFMTGKKGICFPGFEDGMTGCDIVPGARVVTDGQITTARGMGCTVDLGLELVKLLCGADKAEEIKSKIQY